MLFNEPKLLKSSDRRADVGSASRFSALQRAEIAEIVEEVAHGVDRIRFSALQRAEIAEIGYVKRRDNALICVSVLFNEPKLLKSKWRSASAFPARVSVLFNEPKLLKSAVQEAVQ